MYEDELGNNESSINPETWVFSAISKAIDALGGSDNLDVGYMKFVALVNVGEAIARGQGHVGSDYDEKVSSVRRSDDYKNKKSSNAKMLYESTKKIEYLSQEIGKNTAITSPGKLGKK